MARLGVERHAWLDQMLEGWTDEERDSFAMLLERFSARLALELDGSRGD